MDKQQKKIRQKKDLLRFKMIWTRDLSWMIGFPVHGPVELSHKAIHRLKPAKLLWKCIKTWDDCNSPCLQIDHRRIQDAIHSAKKLRNSYPHITERFFSNSKSWFELFEHRIHSISQMVSGNGPIAPSPTGQLKGIQASICYAKEFQPNDEEPFFNTDFGKENFSFLNQFYKRSSFLQIEQDSGLSNSDWLTLLLYQLESVLKAPSVQQELSDLLFSEPLRTLNLIDPIKPYQKKFTEAKHSFANAYKNNLRKKAYNSQHFSFQSEQATILSHLQLLAEKKPTVQKTGIQILCSLFSKPILKKLDVHQTVLVKKEAELRQFCFDFLPHKDERNPFVCREIRSYLEHLDPKYIEEPERNDLFKNLHNNNQDAHLFWEDPILGKAAVKFLAEFQSFPVESQWLIDLLRRSLGSSNQRKETIQEFQTQILNNLVRLAQKTNNRKPIIDAIYAPVRFGLNEALFSTWLFHYSHNDDSWKLFSKSHCRRQKIDKLFKLLELYLTFQLVEEIEIHNLQRSLAALAISNLPLTDSLNVLKELHQNSVDFYFIDEEIETWQQLGIFPQQMVSYQRKIEASPLSTDQIQSLLPIARIPHGRTLILHWIETAQWKKLELASNMLKQISRRKNATTGSLKSKQTLEINPFRESTTSKENGWVLGYPKELHEELRKLSLVFECPENVAQSILGKQFPKSTDFDEEIRNLLCLVQKDCCQATKRERIQSRIQNLLARKSTPIFITDKKAKKFQKKIRTRFLQQLESKLFEEYRKLWVETLPPSLRSLQNKILGNPLHEEIVNAIIGLKRKQRQYGIQLFRLGLAGDSFQEMDEPANQKFVYTQKSHGIEMEPWLAPKTKDYQNDQGETFRLSAKIQPMDYLLMGHHFDTCLGLDGCNFYSTISNAVDVNKRVIYGYDAKGKTIGRCLIALTEDGKIAKFRSYNHNRKTGFSEFVKDYIKTLCGEMKTSTASYHDKIPNLVSSSWYNDGVETDNTVNNKPDGMTSLRAAATQIEKFTPENLTILDQSLEASVTTPFCTLMEGFKNVRLESIVWERIVDHLLKQGIDEIQRIEISDLLVTKKENDLAWKIIKHIPLRQWMKRFQSLNIDQRCYQFRHDLQSKEFVKFLLSKLPPTISLRLVRSSRSREIRNDLQETYRFRRELLADIHLRLGRNQLASQLSIPPTQTQF